MMTNVQREAEALARLSMNERRWRLDKMIQEAFEKWNVFALDYNARVFSELRRLGAWPPSGGAKDE